jgi:serine protease Do
MPEPTTATRGARTRLRRALLALIAPVLAAAVVVPAVPAPAAADGPPSFADLVARVAPAVVNVATRKDAASPAQGGGGGGGDDEDRQTPDIPQFPPGSPFEEFFKDFFNRDKRGGGEQQQQQQPARRAFSLGSGFVIDPRGFVVTNNHVIADSDEVTVSFGNEHDYPAKIIGRDTKTDLALLKIERAEPFPFVEWADSDKVRVGDWMVAIGNPFGLGSTVTAGIVSARGRDIRAGPYDDFLQVDAAINRGNSGGPSFTPDGKVLGINTAIFSPTGTNVGIGFAIPSNLAKPVIDSLLNTGRVARGWLGVRIQTVDQQLAETFGLKDVHGALVASTTPGGPAEKAGIQQGDVVTEFDGKRIDKMRSLPRIVAETAIGKEVDVKIWRKGQEQDVKVTLGELPEDEQVAAAEQKGAEPPSPTGRVDVDPLGVTLAAITPELKTQFSIADNAKGVVVTDVKAGSPAADEVKAGDLVVEVAQEPVGSPSEAATKINQARKEKKKSVLLLIDRQGDLRFVALRFKE